MATTLNLRLIGVRKDELDIFGKPRIFSQLQNRFRGSDLTGRRKIGTEFEMFPVLITSRIFRIGTAGSMRSSTSWKNPS
jgi:hypothetical protein